MNVFDWASKHGVGPVAIMELLDILDPTRQSLTEGNATGSEGAVQAKIRLAAATNGCALWRNNSGALPDARGIPVRFGLGNDSSKLNAVWKSSDLIGIMPVMIEQSMVGSVVGRFWAVECKAPGWKGPRSEHEQAQLRFINTVNALGGQASFATDVKDVL